MAEQWLVFFGLMATVASGVFIIVRGLKHREQSLEMAHRERMAMIDKGLVPSPEWNPAHAAWSGPPSPFIAGRPDLGHASASSVRSTTLGIVVVAIGLGFMTLIGIAADAPGVAIGIGGAIAIVGLAFIAIGQMKRHASPPTQVPLVPNVRPPAPPDPPHL